jgi:hypothetical protein
MEDLENKYWTHAISGYSWGSCCSIFSFLYSEPSFILLFFGLWSLCCLSFCLFFCSFVFGHCTVCPSVYSVVLLSLVIVLFVLLFILLFFCLWSLYCLSFDLPLITPLVSFRNTFSRIGVECTLYLI